MITDISEFISPLKEEAAGIFLRGLHCSYNFSLATSMSIICYGDLDVDLPSIKLLVMEMASLNPNFGYACTQDERYRRNRVTLKMGTDTVESWVGRDLEKYIPGVYWWTILPENLTKKHGVSLKVFERAAKEHIALPNGQHLFRFYERPEDWSKSSVLSELSVSREGIFNIERIETHLATAKTFLELNAMLKLWR